MSNLIFYLITFLMSTTMTVKSPAFKHNETIPDKYTCQGQSINPEIDIEGIPEKTKTLALIMDDPDAPNGTFDHWVMWNIPRAPMIAENSAPGKQGKNGKHENKYTGPCPPSGTHHYHFNVYALDSELSLGADADKSALEKAMEGHILAKAEMIGLYKK